MTVYVDDAFIPYRGMQMCHLVADSSEELLAMVRKIGVPAKWIQRAGTPGEHFDICKSKRAAAIRRGAVEVTRKEIAEIRRRKSL